jgi:hypothetical protein
MPLGCWFTGPFNLTSRMMMFLPEGVEILRIMVRYLARSLLVVAVEPEQRGSFLYCLTATVTWVLWLANTYSLCPGS